MYYVCNILIIYYKNEMTMKKYDEILENTINALNAISAPKTGYKFKLTKNSSDDIMGIISNYLALNLAELNEMIVAIMASRNPKYATSRTLRNWLEILGLQEKQATQAIVNIEIRSNVDNYNLPQNTKFYTESQELVFYTEEDNTISDTSSNINIYAEEFKFQSIEDNAIKTCSDPNITIISSKCTDFGTDDETDDEIRQRIISGTSSTGLSWIENIDTSINNIDGVRFVTSYIGSTGNTQGIPVGSLCCVVIGGDDDEVAKTLMIKNTSGLEYYGNITKIVTTDLLKYNYTIKFFRPEAQQINLKITLKNNTKDDIKPLIYQDLSSILLQYNPNSTIYASELITSLSNVTYAKIIAIKVNDTDVVEIQWNKYPNIAITDIAITEV